MLPLRQLWYRFASPTLWVCRCVGSLVLLYLVLQAVPFQWTTLSDGLRYPLLACAALLVYGPALAAIEGARYWCEARRQGLDEVSFLKWARIFVCSRPWAYVVPIGVAGEVAMLMTGRRDGWDPRQAFRVLLFVRLTGLLAWAIWCGVASGQAANSSLFAHLPYPLAQPVFWYGLGVVGLFFFIGHEWLNERPAPIASIALTFGSNALGAATTYLAAVATGIQMNILEILGFLGILNFALVLPVSLGGIGVQEAILFAMMKDANVPLVSLMTFSTLLHLQRLLLAAVGAVLAVIDSH